jgi:hypothetical protein
LALALLARQAAEEKYKKKSISVSTTYRAQVSVTSDDSSMRQ